MDMSYLAKRIILFGFMMILLSCEDQKSAERQRKIYLNYVINDLGIYPYYQFYNTVSDTLNNWISNKLIISKMQRFSKWELDSLVCLNGAKTKCIMAIVNQESETVNNSINFLYGARVEKEWYFFYGPTVYPDPLYHTPLSFTKLHEIAMQEVFSGYLKKKDLGFWRNVFGKTEYEVNEAFFNQLDYSKWGFIDKEGNVVDNSKLSQAQLDSHLLAKAVYDKWNYRDTTHYKPVP